MKPNTKAQAILKRTEYATLATVDEQGLPWNAPVYFAFDQDFNLYWGSHKDSQHSQNIENNGHVFIVVYNSTVLPGKGEGVYIRAHCAALAGETEITAIHSLLQDRRSPIPYWKREQFKQDGPIRLYKAVPEHLWMNNGSAVDNTYIDTRISVEEQ